MKLCLLAVILTAATAISCERPASNTSYTASPAQAKFDPPDANVPMIVLEQSDDAFGGGLPFNLSVYADGKVDYKPRGVVSMSSVMSRETPKPSPTPAVWTISNDELQRMLDEFTKADFFALQNKYQDQNDGCPNYFTDAPMVYITMNLRDKSKKIAHYQGCREVNSGPVYPRALKTLEDKIAEIALAGHVDQNRTP
jgi:hypothetical protein